MHKAGFRALCQMHYTRAVFFHRGDAHLLRMSLSESWEINTHDATYLSEEFFNLLEQAEISPEMIRIDERIVNVQAAQDELEKFQRSIMGEPEGAYSFVETDLVITPSPDAEYRIGLDADRGMDDAGAIKGLCAQRYRVQVDRCKLVLSLEESVPDKGMHSAVFVRVVRSPLLSSLQEASGPT